MGQRRDAAHARERSAWWALVTARIWTIVTKPLSLIWVMALLELHSARVVGSTHGVSDPSPILPIDVTCKVRPTGAGSGTAPGDQGH